MRQELNQLVGTRDEAVSQLSEWGLDAATAGQLASEADAKAPYGQAFASLTMATGGRRHGNAYVQHKDGEYRVWTEL
jgi:hypothetical protein